MKQKPMTAITLGSGIACAVLVMIFMASVQGEAQRAQAEALARYGGEQVEVCVAARDIAAGERIDHSALESKLWVAGLLPEGSISDSAEAVGQTATSSIIRGEVINAKRFESDSVALDIPDGKQAVSVPVKTVQAVGGTIGPGMRVNVYASGDTSTAVLADDVLVLDSSVAEGGTLSSSSSGWVTLAVDPERVQEIIAASNKTSLYFVIPGEGQKGGKQDD